MAEKAESQDGKKKKENKVPKKGEQKRRVKRRQRELEHAERMGKKINTKNDKY